MTSAATPAPTSSAASRRVPLDKRKRTETSCDKCKSRKQKCRKEPGEAACRYCIVHNIACLTTQPRKKRLYGSVEGLGTRLALLEALVKGLLPEADVSDLDSLAARCRSLGIALPEATLADDGETRSSDHEGDDDSTSLLPDQQGQVQYIGPASSFSFHLNLRTLVNRPSLREFVLFGRNPIEGSDDIPPAPRSASEHEAPSLGVLIRAYFEHINIDFPVLHEQSFHEAYEAWVADPGTADPSWLCGFLCVLLLSRRVARVTFPEDQERLWWRRVQTLLPVVIFTSSVGAVQAMMLAAIHLHNTNHRDACWNLTGTAVRVAFAIGLHQDRVNTVHTPLARELRKRLWWTLYAFEQMQVSSYDRPSAVPPGAPKIACPVERIIGIASHYPPDYCDHLNRLVIHLGAACRAPKTLRPNSNEESYVGPLSPAATALRDMERWRELLPVHLRLDAVHTAPPAFHRPLLLLHAMFHYTIIVLCRAALLARASCFAKEGIDSPNAALISMADSCSESGRDLGQILLRLESIGKFDAMVWWDTWYLLAASSVLVLDLVCLNKMEGADTAESQLLLSQLADLAQHHRRNPHMPGTLEKFASLIPELHSMAESINSHQVEDTTITDPGPVLPHPQDIMAYSHPQSITNSGAYMLADNPSPRFYPDPGYAAGPYLGARLDRNTQTNFMDFTINNINEWNWGDLGCLLGTEAVPHVHPHLHSHVPPGPPPPRPGPS